MAAPRTAASPDAPRGSDSDGTAVDELEPVLGFGGSATPRDRREKFRPYLSPRSSSPNRWLLGFRRPTFYILTAMVITGLLFAAPGSLWARRSRTFRFPEHRALENFDDLDETPSAVFLTATTSLLVPSIVAVPRRPVAVVEPIPPELVIDCADPPPPRRRYLLFPSHEEQLSNARLHFAEWVYVARISNRTLVLPRVGESQIMLEGKFRFGAYFDRTKVAEYAKSGVVDYDDFALELARRGVWEKKCGKGAKQVPGLFTVTGLVSHYLPTCIPDPKPAKAPNDKPHPLHLGQMHLRYLNTTLVPGASALDWGSQPQSRPIAPDNSNLPRLDTLRRVVLQLRQHEFARYFSLDTSPADSQPSDRIRCLVPRDIALDEDGEVMQTGDDLSILRQIQPSDLEADIWLVTKTHLAGDWRVTSWDHMAEADSALEYSPFVVSLVDTAAKRAGLKSKGYIGVHWRMEEADFQQENWAARGMREDAPEVCAEMLVADIQEAAKGLGEEWTVYVSTDHTDPETLELLGLAKSSSQRDPATLGNADKRKIERLKTERKRRERAWARLKKLLEGKMRTFFDALTADEITGPAPHEFLVNSTGPSGHGIARDPGMLGIADKLLLQPAKVFLWGQPPCSRHFTHYAWEVELARTRNGLPSSRWGNITAFLESKPG